MKTSLKIFTILLMYSLTANGQLNWRTTYEFPGGPKIGISFLNDTILFVGVTTGVLRSYNDGNDFEQVLAARAVYTVFTSKSGIVFAGGPGRIYRSADSGSGWDSISISNIIPVTQFIEDHMGNLYAITGILDVKEGYVGEGVFFSDDQGLTWTKRITGLGIYNSCQKIAVDKNGRLYLAMADEYVTGQAGLFISDNQGLLWEHIPVRIDGKGTVANAIKVGNTTGLSVSPRDSIYFSFTGIADNALVSLNLMKSIEDIRTSNDWRVLKVFDAVSWWLDRNLNDIYFAKDGYWFSSFSGSVNTGGTYLSADNGKKWTRIDAGLGADIFGMRNNQYFDQKGNGKLFMIHYLSELVHIWGEDLPLGTHPETLQGQWTVFPNPVNPGERITFQKNGNFLGSDIFLYDITGRIINTWNILNDVKIEIPAPLKSGIYFIGIKKGEKLSVEKILVQ